MPRRTKLLITAVFLVLLAIPVAYIFLTWHPENPLRFRLESAYLEPDVLGNGTDAVLEVTIENTSSAPICLLDGLARFQQADGPRNGLVGSLISTHVLRGRDLVRGHLPPKGTMRSGIYFFNAGEDFPEGDLYVEYNWVSVGKSYPLRVSEWLYHRLPQSLGRRLPHPAIGWDQQPLQPAPTSPWPLKRLPEAQGPFVPYGHGIAQSPRLMENTMAPPMNAPLPADSPPHLCMGRDSIRPRLGH